MYFLFIYHLLPSFFVFSEHNKQRLGIRLDHLFLRHGTVSGPGMGPYPPKVELAQYANPSQSEIGRWGWDFHTVLRGIHPGDIRVHPWVVGVLDVRMDSDAGMRPYRPRVTLTLCTSSGQ